MKKNLVLAMMAVMTVSLVGCGGKNNTTDNAKETSAKGDSSVSVETSGSTETESATTEVKNDLDYATLYDKYVGYTVTIGYPKDAGFTVTEKNSHGVAPKISVSDGTNEVELWYYDHRTLTTKIEDAQKAGENVMQFTVGDMPGYISMKDGKTFASGLMTLIGDGYPDTGKNDTLVIAVSNKNRDADAMKAFFESDTLMTMLESITFKKTDAPDYPGKLSYDHLVGMNVEPAGAFENEYQAYDTYLIRSHIKVDGKELGYVSATVDKNSGLGLDEALKALQASKADKYTEGVSNITYGSHQVNMLRYNNTEEYHGYIDINGTAVKISVLVKKGTDTSVFYNYVGTVIDGIYIPQ